MGLTRKMFPDIGKSPTARVLCLFLGALIFSACPKDNPSDAGVPIAADTPPPSSLSTATGGEKNDAPAAVLSSLDIGFLKEADDDLTEANLSADYLRGVWAVPGDQAYAVGSRYYELSVFYKSGDYRSLRIDGDESAYLGINRKGYLDQFDVTRAPEPDMTSPEGYSRYSVKPTESLVKIKTLNVFSHDGETFRNESESNLRVVRVYKNKMIIDNDGKEAALVRIQPPVREKIIGLNHHAQTLNTAILVEKCETELKNGKGINTIDGFVYEPILIEAAKNANRELLLYMIKKGADVNIRDGNFERFPLLFAAESGNVEIAKILLDNGADINAIDEVGYTPLSNAVINGHLPLSRFLVRQGADIEKGQYTHSTGDYPALNAAIRMNDPELLQLLIDKGADINEQDYPGYGDRRNDTALIQAAWQGLETSVNFLVMQNADPAIRGYEDKTALERAEENKYARIASVLKGLGNAPFYTRLPNAAALGDDKTGRLFPAGWSDKGVLAVAGWLPLDGRPHSMRPFLRVVDLVEDKLLFEHQFKEITGEDETVKKDKLAQCFLLNKQWFVETFIKYSIRPLLTGNAWPADFAAAGRNYAVRVEGSPESVISLSHDGARKAITRLDAGQKVTVLGVLKSPLEDRIAVVTKTEGGASGVTIAIYGSHLVSGF